MPIIRLQTLIQAPIDRCFDLSRSIDLHTLSTQQTDEKAVAGVVSGLINLHETVTWEATHFGVRQKLTSSITVLERPHRFVDEMVKGAFKRIWHEHRFEALTAEETHMTDTFDYTSPLGFLGKLADALFLEKYMTRLLLTRNQVIKEVAESNQWKALLQREKILKLR
ncbi:SRPBCC family protein [Rufibacter latericius]|uniref:Cell division protein n=1 Tax=Rufibacter latericius TaxID=2487040 RepID=A0A3M9MZ54_9BACT|nr:SRPBCC family protein [Rufibacter latericius]RNI30445.1 cell division protein [Rufibacter latericius]